MGKKNIKFSDIYKKEEEVIKRKPDKRTAFLDKLRAAIIEKCKEEGYFPQEFNTDIQGIKYYLSGNR